MASLAAKNIVKSKAAGKKQYDRKVRFSSLQPGGRVLVRDLSERDGPGKRRSYWEQQIHVVVGQKGNLRAFEVRPARPFPSSFSKTRGSQFSVESLRQVAEG